MYDAIIIGGGLAGLSAAHRLRHRNILLLERDNRFGGRIHSERRGEYWLNWGGHVYNGPGSATGELLASVGVDSTPVPGSLSGLAMNGKLITDGRVETYPFRVPMSWRDRAALVKAGAKVRLNVMRYAKIAAPRDGEDYRVRQQRIYDFLGEQTFSEFVGELPNDADALFRPTVSRSAGDPEQVSAGAGVGYFHLVWDRSGGLSRNIIGGPSTLTETIGAELGDRAKIGAQAHEVVHARDHAIVRYSHGGTEHEVKAKYVVLATTAPVARDLAPDLESDVRDALGKIVYGPYVSAAFLTNETTRQKWDDSYAIATPKRAFNVFFNMSSTARGAESHRRPGSSIMAFSPARFARPLIDLPDEEILDRYYADLDDIFPGFPSLVTEAKVERWKQGLAYCFPGRGRLQPTLTRRGSRIMLAGDFLGTWYTETAVQSGFAAAQDILSALAVPASSPQLEIAGMAAGGSHV
ncbi:NAD(P)/FAD-dependent oxidoreductase [Gordonia sp. ABSL1-1]|uniref:protoporphyrinogen/coproporphyrinogen oxidase n=1 Tax=Gordonia sp. ABSL1-1 TaxID=3053923 RepID=UPI002573BCA7|nr:NAD(P)/FAD-dependent oxidoreductase [Gordonia sp. ABSL1-1]MDL9938645.1 NAD(P)/FAD-dependent oxidoreductase [Gordonia sp. ABSL1-1]